MSDSFNKTSQRKKEHLDLCLKDEVAFKTKTTGFDKYEFIHYAITEVDLSAVKFETNLFKKTIQYPFLISCMTGGTTEAEMINQRLATVAENLKIAVGVGSQRAALEDSVQENSFKIIRKNAPSVPVFGNIGAAQLVQMNGTDEIQKIIDMISADAIVIHLNPVQELVQPEGEPFFTGLLKKINELVKKFDIPFIAKEVGSGISKSAAEKLLQVGVKGIDVAGAGGTSWAGVENLRNKKNENLFWDWGLPTSFCIRKVCELKQENDFLLIGSGGINSAEDMAKAFALGADLTASARIILQKLFSEGEESVIELISSWFDHLKKIMFLTGSQSIDELSQNKLILKEELF